MTNPSRNFDSYNTSKESQRIADLRSQVTIVAPKEQETLNPLNVEKNNFNTTKSEVLSLPFTAGNYVATEILAKGGMSTTYLGVALNDKNQKVVIKIPDTSSSKTIEMFKNECAILTELHHPNIVPVLEIGNISVSEDTKFPYMVMKFIAGQSLRQKLDTQGKFSWKEVVSFLEDIASALQYLFENNFCHRDIKPANIVFDLDTHHWILVDFGIAKSMQNNIMATMTIAGQDSGTWDYMPPEQLEGKVVDIRCDIYALGTVAWEALIGKVPRRGTNLPSTFIKDLPSDVDVLIKKMVEHNQEDRYQTPADVLQALHRGAQKIENLIHLKHGLKKISRYTIWSLATLVFLIVLWVTSNFFINAKIKEIFDANKNSPTITIREIKRYISKVPFWLGQHYWSAIKNDLHVEAIREKKKMETEYSNIKSQILKIDGEDSELTNQKLQCENFINKWNKIFINSSEIKQAITQKKVLTDILLHRNEKKQLDLIIAEAKKISIDCENTQANFQRAISNCKDFESKLIFNDLKQEMQKFINELKKQAITSTLALVDNICSDGSGENLFKAYQKLNDVKQYAGDDEKLLEKMNEIDDKFWIFYSEQALKELKENHFTNARSYANQYPKLGKAIGMSRNLLKYEKLITKIKDNEEVFDWNATVKYSDKVMKDKAFPSAFIALEKFEKKYPNTKVNIAKNKEIIASNFVAYIITKRESLDDYQEHFDTFVKLFSTRNSHIPDLQRNLCWSVWKEIEKIMFGDSSAKTELLTQIKYTKCADYQKQYLNTLKKYAIDAAATPGNKFKWYSFRYRYERPPKDCVNLSEPNIYWVHITEFSYDMSYGDYNSYKGFFDADIEIQIQENTDDTPWKISAPVNRRAWNVSSFNGKNIAFWFDTKGSALTAGIIDSDTLECGPSRLVEFYASQFSRSGESSYTFDSGTKISIKWTAE